MHILTYHTVLHRENKLHDQLKYFLHVNTFARNIFDLSAWNVLENRFTFASVILPVTCNSAKCFSYVKRLNEIKAQSC